MLRTLFEFANLTVDKLLDELLYFVRARGLIVIDEPNLIIKEMLHSDIYDNASPQAFLFLYELRREFISFIDDFILQLLTTVKADIKHIREFKCTPLTGEVKYRGDCLYVEISKIGPAKGFLGGKPAVGMTGEYCVLRYF